MFSLALAAALALPAAGCHSTILVDTKPLDDAGMSYDAVEQLRSLNVTSAEVAEIAQARAGGLSDDSCVQLVKIYRGRNQSFDAGAAVAGLLQAGMSEDSVLALARLKQLGLGVGEFQAMRLAGLSDSIVLELARHRAVGKPDLSGASLATMKNAGMSQGTLFELARHGVPDSEANAILAFRRHGASDTEILRRFTGS